MQCLGSCRERRARHILGAEAESLRQDTTRRLGGRYQCHLGVTVCERLGTACRLSARGQTPENLDNWLKRCPCLWRFRCRLVASPPPVSKGQPFSVGLFHCGMARVRGGSCGFLRTSGISLARHFNPTFALSRPFFSPALPVPKGRSPQAAKFLPLQFR